MYQCSGIWMQIRIPSNVMFLGLPDPHPYPSVRSTDPMIRILIRIRHGFATLVPRVLSDLVFWYPVPVCRVPCDTGTGQGGY
jgi:hypothetical protein